MINPMLIVVAVIDTGRRMMYSALNMGFYRLPYLFIALSERPEKAPEDHVLRRSGKGRLIKKVLIKLRWQVRDHFNLLFFRFKSDHVRIHTS